jgi:GNAT superfamily N-acetyltransferase
LTDEPDDITAISDAFTAHWQMFGLYPGAELHEEEGVLWYRSPIRHLPYNAVVRTRIAAGADPESIVTRVCRRYRELGLPFMWVVLPRDTPQDLDVLLRRAGLDMVEEVTGMSLDFSHWTPLRRPLAVEIEPANEEPALNDYETMIRTYWDVPEADRDMIRTLNRHWTGERSPGLRLVAYAEGRPVGKLFLNLSTLPVAAVYGVAVVAEARGRGIARSMMETAIDWAHEVGAKRMVLHASPMAKPLYEKLGFTANCSMPVYATAALFGTHHH